MGLPGFEKSQFLNGMKVPWYSIFSFLFFCSEATITRTLGGERFSSRLWHSESYLISAVFKVLNNYRHIDNGIWKDSWRYYGHGSTYVLILSWINIMKQKWAKMPWKLLVVQKSEPVIWRTLHQDISLIIIFFFSLKQA